VRERERKKEREREELSKGNHRLRAKVKKRETEEGVAEFEVLKMKRLVRQILGEAKCASGLPDPEIFIPQS
jgi:hypothetical protein